jgi:GTP-binding protein
MGFDEAKIYVRSGDGGNGLVSFRREKYIPRGGPSGGDGGRGGDVVLRVTNKMNTLNIFKRQVHFKAPRGQHGGSANKTGRGGDTLYINVPPGTIVRDAETDQILGDLTQLNQELVVVTGGRGGRGNARFVSSSNQAPRIAEKGEPGQELWLKLELKLIADVGLVGVPNAGKSTILSVVSNANPKIADYPFTTLEPNLGVVIYDDQDIVFADIPGLIEGAHMGVGLGHSFLRHVQRTRLLIHVLNGASDEVLADYSQINTELALYDENLTERPQIVVFNKIDVEGAEERYQMVKEALAKDGVEVMAISAITQHNIRQLIQRVAQMMSELPTLNVLDTESEEGLPLYELEEDDLPFEIVRELEGYRVIGKRIERAASMTQWDYEQAVMRFQDILETLGVTKALQDAGIEVGDTVYIGDHELEWSD